MSLQKKILQMLIPLMLLAAGLFLVPIEIYDTDFSKVPGDFGDARFNNYILEHGHKYLTGQIGNYWDAPFMYPYKNVIALSDNLIGTVPLYSFFRITGSDRETSFQLWLLTLFALNYICCFWALKKWSGDALLSGAGAYIYSFSIFILGHITNVQVFPRFMIPFIFYWSWQYLSKKQLKYFLFASAATVFQFYCGIYLGFFLLYTLLFLFIAYILVYRDIKLFSQFRAPKIAISHVLILAVSGLLLLPLMMPYIEVSRTLGMRNFEDALTSIPTLRSYFFTSKAPVLWRLLSEHAIPHIQLWWCHFLFTGAVPWFAIAAIPVILIRKKSDASQKKFIVFLLLGLFLSFIFCLNINGFTLYKFVFELPGFASMRAINRIINTEIIFFILIFVFVFRELKNFGRIPKVVVMMLPFLVILDNLIDGHEVVRYDKQGSQKEINAVRKKIEEQYDKKFTAIAYLPDNISGNEVNVQLNTMLAAQELNIPCVNAYSGTYPAAFNYFFSSADSRSLDEWLKFNSATSDTSRIQRISDSGKNIVYRKEIFLKASNGKYVSADKNVENAAIANRDHGWQWETFLLIMFENNECALRAYDGRFLSVETEKQNRVIASGTNIDSHKFFTLFEFDSGHIALKACNSKFIRLDFTDLNAPLFAESDSAGNEEKFETIPK